MFVFRADTLLAEIERLTPPHSVTPRRNPSTTR
jgi:hypothetical protein